MSKSEPAKQTNMVPPDVGSTKAGYNHQPTKNVARPAVPPPPPPPKDKK